jgi:FkbM family methyltransferase
MKKRVSFENKKLIYGWWLPIEDTHFEHYFSYQSVISGRSLYQPKHLSRCFHYIKDLNTAIDIGAHCGFWSYYLGGNFKKVYAFEPVKIFADCFKMNVPFDNVELIPFPLGNSNEDISMEVDSNNSGASHVSTEIHGDKISLKKLDDYNLKDINFIKIDVEGYESQVVLGAKETLIRNKPIVIVEQKGYSNRYNIKENEAIDTLKNYGAKIIEQVGKDLIMGWET